MYDTIPHARHSAKHTKYMTPCKIQIVILNMQDSMLYALSKK